MQSVSRSHARKLASHGEAGGRGWSGASESNGVGIGVSRSAADHLCLSHHSDVMLRDLIFAVSACLQGAPASVYFLETHQGTHKSEVKNARLAAESGCLDRLKVRDGDARRRCCDGWLRGRDWRIRTAGTSTRTRTHGWHST